MKKIIINCIKAVCSISKAFETIRGEEGPEVDLGEREERERERRKEGGREGGREGRGEERS